MVKNSYHHKECFEWRDRPLHLDFGSTRLSLFYEYGESDRVYIIGRKEQG